MENIPNVPQLPWIPSFYNFNVNCNLEFLLKFIKEELSNLEDIQYFLIKNKFSIKFYINNYLIYIKIRIYKYNVNDKLNYLIDISFMNGNKFIFIRWFRALRYNLYINNLLISKNVNFSNEIFLYPKNKIYKEVSEEYIKYLIEKINSEIIYYEEISYYLIIIANLSSNKQNAINFKNNNISFKIKNNFIKIEKVKRLINKITLNLKYI